MLPKALIFVGLLLPPTRWAIIFWECSTKDTEIIPEGSSEIELGFFIVMTWSIQKKNIVSITHLIIQYFILSDFLVFYGRKKLYRNYFLKDRRAFNTIRCLQISPRKREEKLWSNLAWLTTNERTLIKMKTFIFNHALLMKRNGSCLCVAICLEKQKYQKSILLIFHIVCFFSAPLANYNERKYDLSQISVGIWKNNPLHTHIPFFFFLKKKVCIGCWKENVF